MVNYYHAMKAVEPKRKKLRESEAQLEETRKRVEELVSAGMPFQMAMSVAKERMSLNEALERMAQRADALGAGTSLYWEK